VCFVASYVKVINFLIKGVERGVRNVSLVNIEKIAKGLKKSLPELFSRV
jgi:hypothetical protein